MRFPLRSAGTLLLAIGVATCADAPTVARARTSPSGSVRSVIGVQPVFSKQAAAIYAQRAQFAGASFDHVHIVIRRPPGNEIVKDTIIVFTPGSQDQIVELDVDVASVNEAFGGQIDYTNNGSVVYSSGPITLVSHPVDQPAPPQPPVVIVYVGPGSTASKITVSPKTVNLVSPATATFTVSATDAANAPISPPPVNWTVSDPTIATISSSGVLTPSGKRGTVTITATSLTNLTDNASAVITLPASAIALVSGGGQIGKAGATLAQPAVVRVTASDGFGVAGVPVNFAAPTGGKVGAASATTDAQGNASTSLTLAGTIGPQSFAATAASGTLSVSIPATATAGDPASIVAVSGSGQQDTVRKALKQPFVVKVTDAFGNAVSGATVSWTRTAGTGTVGAATSVTGADGTASTTYTLGTTPGQETVQASVAGVNQTASFTVTATTSGPANIAIVSGASQTGRIQQALASPLVVKVTDDAGLPVNGVVVSWSAGNGTISSGAVTDAQGLASATFTLGPVAGTASATASIPNGKSVSFSATVLPGTVAKVAFRAAPPNVAANTVLSPAVQVELRDAGNNLTNAANSVTIALGANPGNATLGGTLTVNAVAGVASFSDLTISAPGTGYTLVATSAGAGSATSAAFNIGSAAPGPPFKLAIVTQPSTPVVSGVPFSTQPVIQVQDQAGNAVGTPSPLNVTAVWSTGSERNNVAAVNTTTGVAAFTNFYIIGSGTGPVVFSAPGLQSVSSVPITATTPAATALRYQVQPASGTAGSALGNIVVQVVDAQGAVVTSATNSVTLAFGANPGSGTLSGTATVAAVNGVATFAGLSIDKAAIGYTLVASATGLTSVTSTTFNISAGAPAKYAVTAPTTTPTTGSTTTITATLQDQFNNPIPTASPRTINWTLSGGGSVAPPSSATNASGQATTVYTASVVPATAGTVTATDATNGAITGSLVLTSTSAGQSKLAVTSTPPGSIPDRATLPSITVTVEDASSNAVPIAGVSVVPMLTAAPTGATLVGGSPVSTNGSGQATFSNLSFQGPAGSYTITFSATGLTSTQVTILNTPGAAAGLAKLSGDGQVGVVNAALPTGLRVQLLDADGNPTTGPATTVSFTTSSGSVTPSAGTDGAGRATATWTMPASPGAVTMNATATFGGVPATVTFNATASTVTAMTFVTPPPPTAQSDIPIGTVIVQLVDAQSRPMNAAGVPVTVSLRYDPGCSGCGEIPTPSLVGTLTVNTNASGQAVFSDLAMSGSFDDVVDLLFNATVGSPLPTLSSSAITFSGPPQGSFLTATGPRAFSVVFGSSFSSYPIAHVTDANNQPVAGVTVSFTAFGDPSCDTQDSPINVVSNANGDAALTPALLPFNPTAPTSCAIFANAPFIEDEPTWVLVARPAGTVTWTGITSGDWTDPTNWLPSGPPATTDNVFIPPTTFDIATMPASGSITINDLVFGGLESSGVDLGGTALTIHGSMLGIAGGLFTSNGGSVLLNKPGAGTLSGLSNAPTTIGSPGCAGGTTYSLAGSFTVGDLTVNCPVDLNNTSLVASGNTVVQNSGKVILTQAGSLLETVDLTMQGASAAGTMTAGHVFVNGNMSVKSNVSIDPFAPTGTSDLNFFGGSAHTLTFGPNTLSNLASLNIVNGTGALSITSSNTVALSGSLTVLGSLIVPASTAMTVAGAGSFGVGSSTTVTGSLSLGPNAFFTGGSSVTGTGTLSITPPCTKQSGATVNVNGNTASACSP